MGYAKRDAQDSDVHEFKRQFEFGFLQEPLRITIEKCLGDARNVGVQESAAVHEFECIKINQIWHAVSF